MRKILLTVVSGFSLCATPLHAQFNTIAPIPVRYKVEALRMDMKSQEPTPGSMAPAQDASGEVVAEATPSDAHKNNGLTVISASHIRFRLSRSLPLTVIAEIRSPVRNGFMGVSTYMLAAIRRWR